MGAGIINIVGNFGTVFCDQSYWQSAIAANPASAHKGYLLGGIVWFTIPFALATALGASSLGLAYCVILFKDMRIMSTFPRRLYTLWTGCVLAQVLQRKHWTSASPRTRPVLVSCRPQWRSRTWVTSAASSF